MSTRERPADRGTRRGIAAVHDLAVEFRNARAECGVSQGFVARALGMSASQISRIERGLVPTLSIVDASRIAAVLALDLSTKLYPAGPRVRDAAHRALLERFRTKLPTSIRVSWEVGLPIPGDARAWDMALDADGWHAKVEAETRLRDIQALQRRVALKVRDDPMAGHVILLVSRTRGNRTALDTYRDALLDDFPVPGRVLLAALQEGVGPPGSGIVLM